jgi:hypothetical protein
MSRQLIALNAALVLLALVSVGYMVRELRTPEPAPERRAAAPTPPTVAPAAPAAESVPAGGYGVVASRNLFSPNRSEAHPPPPASAAAQAPPQPKPNLYGILLSGSTPVAYLEDPTTKRVAGYRPGDSIAGGTVKQIGADHVVLNRPEGEVSVRLRDPSKPRPPAPVAGQPGGGQPAPLPGERGTPPVAGGPTFRPPVAPQAPGAATQNPQGGATVLPRRPLPPNLLRRLPPPATDAQPQN